MGTKEDVAVYEYKLKLNAVIEQLTSLRLARDPSATAW